MILHRYKVRKILSFNVLELLPASTKCDRQRILELRGFRVGYLMYPADIILVVEIRALLCRIPTYHGSVVPNTQHCKSRNTGGVDQHDTCAYMLSAVVLSARMQVTGAACSPCHCRDSIPSTMQRVANQHHLHLMPAPSTNWSDIALT